MRARRISEGERTQSGVDHMGLAVKAIDLDMPAENLVGAIRDSVLSDVDMAPQVGEATDESRTEGQPLGPEAKRFCKRCETAAENVAIMVSRSGKPIQVAAEQPVVIAHTGTVHLNAGEGLTLCGLEIPGITA